MEKEHFGIVIVAGGSGRRMGTALPKQFLLLAGAPVLARTINAMARALPGAERVVVLPAEHIGFWEAYARRFDVAQHRTVAGGAERFDSVCRGLDALSERCTLIGVHDGVRPLASPKLVLRTAEAALQKGAAIPVVRPVDSLRAVAPDGGSHPVDRTAIRCVQTPQFFRADLLRDAYRQPRSAAFTDDASVVEAAGHTVALVDGEASNLKITSPDDLTLAEALVAARENTER